MTWKVLSLLFVVAAASAHVAKSEQSVVHHGHHGELAHVGNKPENHEEYAWSYPSYEFHYKVEDPHTHDYKGQHEVRHGDEVKGEYWLLQPDGHKRIVKYHTDKKGGFNAKVEYEKVHEVHEHHHHVEEAKPIVEEPERVAEEPRVEEKQEERREDPKEEPKEERREERREERKEERKEESEEQNESSEEREQEREEERKEEPRSPPKGHKKVIEFYNKIHHGHKPHIEHVPHVDIKPVIKHKVHPPKPIYLERMPLREFNPQGQEESREESGGEREGSEERAERAVPVFPARKPHDIRREPYYGHRRFYRNY